MMRRSGRRDVVDVIVVELDGLDHGLSAIGRDVVPRGNQGERSASIRMRVAG